jgi:hypothetical protein
LATPFEKGEGGLATWHKEDNDLTNGDMSLMPHATGCHQACARGAAARARPTHDEWKLNGLQHIEFAT